MSTTYVGIDFHRRRSVIVRMDAEGNHLGVGRIVNSPATLIAEVEKAGPSPEVVLEATYGWYWAAETLKQIGANVHLAHPLGMKGFTNRRVKNDLKDATLLADLLRMGKLPEAWIAPPALRELRELVRFRHKLTSLRGGLKTQVKAVLAKEGVFPPVKDLWGPGGTRFLNDLELAPAFLTRVECLRDLVVRYSRDMAMLDRDIHDELKADPGYQAIQEIRGVGPVLAAIFCVEVGDVSRFANADKLCCWSGLTPRLRESDRTSHMGSISKQGSKLVRWAAIEAISRYKPTEAMAASYRRIADRRGVNIARVACARQLVTLVFYGLRDGHIRCLDEDVR